MCLETSAWLQDKEILTCLSCIECFQGCGTFTDTPHSRSWCNARRNPRTLGVKVIQILRVSVNIVPRHPRITIMRDDMKLVNVYSALDTRCIHVLKNVAWCMRIWQGSTPQRGPPVLIVSCPWLCTSENEAGVALGPALRHLGTVRAAQAQRSQQPHEEAPGARLPSPSLLRPTCNNEIKRVQGIKYLGVIPEPRLAFHRHLRYAANNANLDIGYQMLKPMYRFLLEELKARKEATLRTWQIIWGNSDKGRTTHTIFPGVQERLCIGKWLVIGHYSAQFLTGHEKLRKKLSSIDLVDHPDCVVCGVPDIPAHTVQYPKIEKLRIEFEGKHEHLRLRGMLRDMNMASGMLRYLTSIGKRREEVDVRWSNRRLSDEFGGSQEDGDDINTPD
ncbi:hypothetical protein PR048_005385 [Dryococelus australis]|uniref:Uncharacterized protein n=1 Tax=Dryococelus australis TaxID=614101 RepID=A0ABQ9I827_9NEOP|nr:hypothetical protein PR048_005385 [Dryococelus australis]